MNTASREQPIRTYIRFCASLNRLEDNGGVSGSCSRTSGESRVARYSPSCMTSQWGVLTGESCAVVHMKRRFSFLRLWLFFRRVFLRSCSVVSLVAMATLGRSEAPKLRSVSSVCKSHHSECIGAGKNTPVSELFTKSIILRLTRNRVRNKCLDVFSCHESHMQDSFATRVWARKCSQEIS